MAHLYRLAVFLLLCWALPSLASITAPGGPWYSPYFGGSWPSPGAACSAWTADTNAFYGVSQPFTPYTCVETSRTVINNGLDVKVIVHIQGGVDFGNPTPYSADPYLQAPICHSGDGRVAGVTCVSPVDAAPGTPQDKAKDLAESLGKDGELCGLGTPTNSMCYQGYVMRGSWSGTASLNGGKDNGFCVFGPFSADGTTCTGDSTTPTGAPTPCTGGKVPGTVNGVEVCVDPGTTSAPGGSSSGSSSGTDGSGNSTGSGTSNTGSQTTCTGNTCTTTTTTTTTTSGGGTGTTTTSTTQPKSTFCAENPASPLCTAGSFSGSCGAAPACTGDAVQCAQARYVFETSCSLAKPGDDNEQLLAFKRAIAAGDGDQTKDLPGNKEVAIGPSSFDGSNPLGTAAGIADLEVVVAGQSFTLPFSMVNEWLAHIGTVLQIVTFLLCIRIVARG